MDKNQLLEELKNRISAGEISKSEMQELFKVNKDSIPATKILYTVGAVIAIIGIIIFIGQIWRDMGSAGRIAVTLGLGFLMAGFGSRLLKEKPDENIGAIFHSLGGMLIPGGAMVVINEIMGTVSAGASSVAFGVIFMFYVLLSILHKHAVLTFFALANGTAFIYTLFEAVLEGAPYSHGDLYAYLAILVGAGYLIISQNFKEGWNAGLVGPLNFFGITGILGGAFSQVFDSSAWQMFYFVLVLAGFYLAVYIKSKSVLVMSTVFLIAHVSYITGKYFADSLGWPISLVVLGFVFIGLGYASVSINRRYIK